MVEDLNMKFFIVMVLLIVDIWGKKQFLIVSFMFQMMWIQQFLKFNEIIYESNCKIWC